MLVRQTRQGAHHRVRPHIDVSDFTGARVGDEQPTAIGVQGGVVEPNRTARERGLGHPSKG